MASTSLLVTISVIIMVLIRTTTCDVECKGVLNLRANDTVDSLESPDFFQSSTLGQINCEAHISADSKSDAVVLELIYFKISGDQYNCTNEYLEVFDGPSTSAPRLRKMCGTISYGHFKSANSDLTVVFHSDGMQNKTGFIFNFYTRKKTNSTIEPCTNVSLVAKETVQFLLSPNYPDWYPSNTDCEWHITTDSQSTVVVLKPAYFQLERRQSECKSDFVSIYDGPSPVSGLKETVCGSNIFTDQYRSSDSSMTIVFHSDGYNNYKGFNFTYQSQKSRGNSDNGPDIGNIFAYVVIGVATPFVIGSFVLFIKKQITRRQLRNIQNDSSSSNSIGEATFRITGNDVGYLPPLYCSDLSDGITPHK